MPIKTIYEEDIVNKLLDNIDYVIEDCGIGPYEWGDGKYVDIDMKLVLIDQEIVIQYPTMSDEQVIYTVLAGSISDDLNEYEEDWIASLNSVIWNPKTCTLDATYQISEN